MICLTLLVATPLLAEDAKKKAPSDFAKNKDAKPKAPLRAGMQYQADVSFRIIPLGFSVTNHYGYHKKLFNSQSVLFKDAYIEAGGKLIISPALAWGGAYLKIEPLALLNMRFTATYNRYFGTFGLIYQPEDQNNPSWTLDNLSASDKAGRGIATGGFTLEAQINPKLRIGDIVAFCPITYSYVSTDVKGKYYEPWYDHLFNETDSLLLIQPTIGMIPYSNDNGTFLMTAFRWEHAETEAGGERDLASILLLWGIPKKWWSAGNPRLAVLAGYWMRHPQERAGSLFLGTNLSMVWGIK